MPRPLRIQFPGAIYHLMNRGDCREPIPRRTWWNEEELKKRPKGDAGKAELARLLRRQTPVSRQWIADRLHIGSASYVSHLVKQKP